MAYWAAVRTEPNRERISLVMLALEKFRVYAPRVRAWRMVRGQRVERITALFPNYLFVEIELQWHRVRQCHGIATVVMVGGAPAKVLDAVIAEIRGRERDGVVDLDDTISTPVELQHGDGVRIARGAFAGRAAIFAGGLNGHGRVAVLLNLLGGQQRVELAAVCDRVEPHHGDPVKFWNGPFQSLCKSCHDSAKRQVEMHGYRRDIGLDDWSLDSRHPVYRRGQ